MRSFILMAAIAAISSAITEECASLGNADDCWTDSSIKDAIAAGTDQYSWARYEVTTADSYNLGMIRLTGDNAGDPFVADEDKKGPVLHLHTAFNDCLSWFDSEDPAIDSIPLQLAKAGYDVWIGCGRGTFLSRTHETLDADDDAEEYWNYDSKILGENDTAAFVEGIIAATSEVVPGMAPNPDVISCEKIQIVNHAYATAETLFYLAEDATAANYVSQVINLAPCAIPTYQLGGVVVDDEVRRLSEADAPEDVRELHAIVEEDVKMGRELGHKWQLSESYWTRTEQYCDQYPASCRNYCSYYPRYCDQFCERFPQFCVPDDIQNYYNFLDLLEKKGIFSLYGPNWEDQVHKVCNWVGHWSSTCLSLKSTIDKGYAEMSVKQLEHLWQNDYNQSFGQFNDNFLEDGWIIDPSTLWVSFDGINVDIVNAYTSVDETCDPEVNQGPLNVLTPFFTQFTDDSITHHNVNKANDNSNLLTYVTTNLAAKANTANLACAIDDRM